MAANRCERCGKRFSEWERYCPRCGFDMMKGRPVLAVGDSKAAKAREKLWLATSASPTVTTPADPEAAPPVGTTEDAAPTNGDAARRVDDSVATNGDAADDSTATTGEASEPPPLDDLVYWSQCTHVLSDLHSAAAAQVELLRRRCLERGVPEVELDQRIEAAMPTPVRAVGAGVFAPAGWYPDPGGASGSRYWTGAAWSERVR